MSRISDFAKARTLPSDAPGLVVRPYNPFPSTFTAATLPGGSTSLPPAGGFQGGCNCEFVPAFAGRGIGFEVYKDIIGFKEWAALENYFAPRP